jgi:hypothetical protein
MASTASAVLSEAVHPAMCSTCRSARHLAKSNLGGATWSPSVTRPAPSRISASGLVVCHANRYAVVV